MSSSRSCEEWNIDRFDYSGTGIDLADSAPKPSPCPPHVLAPPGLAGFPGTDSCPPQDPLCTCQVQAGEGWSSPLPLQAPLAPGALDGDGCATDIPAELMQTYDAGVTYFRRYLDTPCQVLADIRPDSRWTQSPVVSCDDVHGGTSSSALMHDTEAVGIVLQERHGHPIIFEAFKTQMFTPDVDEHAVGSRKIPRISEAMSSPMTRECACVYVCVRVCTYVYECVLCVAAVACFAGTG